MSLINRLFGNAQRAGGRSQLPTQQSSQTYSTSPGATRRELVRVVLRDTLVKHGIPTAWVTSEMMLTTQRDRAPVMHLRLLIRHWDPRLLTYAVALQNSFYHRIGLFDPLAVNWLKSVSWQFALADEAQCPELPDPAMWTTRPADPAATVAVAVAAPAAHSPEDRRAELSRLIAQGDAIRALFHDSPAAAAGTAPQYFAPTEPQHLHTEAAPLDPPRQGKA